MPSCAVPCCRAWVGHAGAAAGLWGILQASFQGGPAAPRRMKHGKRLQPRQAGSRGPGRCQRASCSLLPAPLNTPRPGEAPPVQPLPCTPSPRVLRVPCNGMAPAWLLAHSPWPPCLHLRWVQSLQQLQAPGVLRKGGSTGVGQSPLSLVQRWPRGHVGLGEHQLPGFNCARLDSVH